MRALIAERYTTGAEHEVCSDNIILKRQTDVAVAMAQAVHPRFGSDTGAAGRARSCGGGVSAAER